MPIQLRTRLERVPGNPLVASSPESRTYSLRGEIYLWADRFPLYEIEVAMALQVPTADGKKSFPARNFGRTRTDLMAGMAEQIATLQNQAVGGGLIGEQVEPFWGYERPEFPLFGTIFVRETTAEPARRDATARDLDLLLGRLLYVRNDYPMSVSATGELISKPELDEQAIPLQETCLIASRLPLPQKIREDLVRLGDDLVALSKPDLITRQCGELMEAIRHALWLDLAMPETSKIEEGPALYAQNYASCHGAKGEGPPPEMSALFPPPIPLGNPEVSIGLSPQRVWSAATFGVPGTAMVPLAEHLGEAERWAIAFYVVGMRMEGGVAGPPLPVEDLASLSNEELAWKAPTAEVQAWLRGAGLRQAAARPEWKARQLLRAVAKGEGKKEELSALLAGDPEMTALIPEVDRMLQQSSPATRRDQAQQLAERLRTLELP